MSKSRSRVRIVTLASGESSLNVAIAPASKPRNRLAVDPLLRKSGVHQTDDGKGGKKRARVAEQHLRDALATLPAHARRQAAVQDDDH